MSQPYEETAGSLAKLRSEELSIIRLSEPISTPDSASAPKRSSDASADAFENPTPASLAADLAHYKEYFSKLRFSYLEQVTKEKFLRAIVGDPPQVVEHRENVELEAQLVGVKADLKAQKLQVAEMAAELERRGRNLARRYEFVSLQTTQLSELPSQIAALEESVAALQARQTPTSSNPALSLPLPATLQSVSTKEAELEDLDRELKSVQQVLPRKTRELEGVENELRTLEGQKSGAVAAAKEARKRKEDGERGVGDGMELNGRWYRSVEMGLQEILGVPS